jgi:hypothetical protein
MSDFLKVKDINGNIHQIELDLSFNPVFEIGDDETEWEITMSDPVNIPVNFKHVGGRPNDRR